jgi:hypothetical protein
LKKNATRTGRAALPLVVSIMCAACVTALWLRPAAEAGITKGGLATIHIGPVEGLTTAWHEAPEATAIAQGTVAQFKVDVPRDAVVRWSGAVEIMRRRGTSIAVCPLVDLGEARVTVSVRVGNGTLEDSITLDVVETRAADVTVSMIDVSWDEFGVDESLPTEELNLVTMGYYFGDSIAAVHEIGDDRYRTSIRRKLTMRADVEPAAFAPLVEWRVDGEAVSIGGHSIVKISTVGDHEVSAGPVGAEAFVGVRTYETIITSHQRRDFIYEGRTTTFTAVTNPPGYEKDITWLASTKHGTGVPVVAKGPVFVTRFDDTFGPDGLGGRSQWLGVKGDNATFGQDQKVIDILECATCPKANDACWCIYEVDSFVSGGQTCTDRGLGLGVAFCAFPCIGISFCPEFVTFRIADTDCVFIGRNLAQEGECQDCPFLDEFQWEVR